VIQSIGAVTIEASGGYGTVPGHIFSGIGMGIGNAANSDGATWSIPLFGCEKKIDDISLINVPFFDGRTFGEAANFLSTYAGLIPDFSNAVQGDLLQASSDVNTARYDWKSGTSVRSALEDICNSTLHAFVVIGGVIRFYKVGAGGIPVMPGIDRSVGYDYTTMVSIDETPDFEDLRNEIVVMGLQAIPDAQGSDITSIPTFPRVEKRTNVTTPDVPWAKSMFSALPGNLTTAKVADQADKFANLSNKYLVIGKLTIPGNANILPFDMWGSYWISSVTHNLDLQSIHNG
jgi:hypothetical protein